MSLNSTSHLFIVMLMTLSYISRLVPRCTLPRLVQLPLSNIAFKTSGNECLYCEGGVNVFPRGSVQVISKILRRIVIKVSVCCQRFNNYSSQNFADDLHSASWENTDTSLTVNDAWMAFKRTFMDIVDKHVPFITMRIWSFTLPWLNENIRNLIKERNFHHRKAQKSGSCNDWATYRAIRNQVVSQIRNAKRNYYTNLI